MSLTAEIEADYNEHLGTASDWSELVEIKLEFLEDVENMRRSVELIQDITYGGQNLNHALQMATQKIDRQSQSVRVKLPSLPETRNHEAMQSKTLTGKSVSHRVRDIRKEFTNEILGPAQKVREEKMEREELLYASYYDERNPRSGHQLLMLLNKEL